MNTYTVTKMDYSELEDIVKKQYPKIKEYSFIVIEEANNDNVYEFTGINKKDYEDEWEDDKKEMLQSFQGEVLFPMYRNRLLLLHLCSLDLIPEGDYLIEVSY